MKSLFLQKLSQLLIQDKETDYVDIYNLQTLKDWPIFTISYYSSENGGSTIESKRVELQSEYDEKDVEIMGLDCCELISFSETNLIFDAGGEWQGINRVTISLNSTDELHVESCVPISESETTGRSEGDYEKILEEFQLILENQD